MFFRRFPLFIAFAVISVLGLAGCQSTIPTPDPTSVPLQAVVAEDDHGHKPMVTVSDQEISSDQVTISMVVSDGPGWLVIHAQADGKPGPILGYAPVRDGENANVAVEIDQASATETMYAMLHVDSGVVGTFEFPDGPDAPATADNKVITPAFTVSGLVVERMTPLVTVSDQEIVDGTVTIAKVISEGPGWLVIHAQADGKPGPILGVAALTDGENVNVTVEVEAANATETLYAMLHADAGEVGTFEFPDGPDVPVKVEEKVVTPPFKVRAKEVAAMETVPMVALGGNDDLGNYLVGTEGMTLYIFSKDEPGVSNCYDQCAVNWPPLILEGDQMPTTADEGVTGELTAIEREDGSRQVAYNGWPLYYWINDAAPGDTSGHGVGGVWAVAGVDPVILSIVPGESVVTYEVGETFINQDNRFNVAIGVTEVVEGKIIGDLKNTERVVVGPVVVDISQFTSDSEKRDNKIRSDFLESAMYPLATFAPTEISGIPDAYSEGDQVNLQITGDLTIKEVTNSVTFEANVQFADGTMRGEATTTILMSDFGVGPISILGMLNTEDEVKLAFNFVAR